MVKFNRAKKFTKKNIKNIPKGKTIIYKLKNKNGKNLYTGIAGRGRGEDRLLEHKELKKDKIPGVVLFQIVQVKNKDIVAKLEKQIIKKEQPKFNKENKSSRV